MKKEAVNTFNALVNAAEDRLLSSVIHNFFLVLHHLLPLSSPGLRKSACYAMTDRGYADEECDIQMANSVGKMNAENASSQQGKSIAEVQEVSTPPCIAPSPSAYPSFSHLAYPVCFPYCIHDQKTRNVVSLLREALNSSSNAPLMTSPRPRMPSTIISHATITAGRKRSTQETPESFDEIFSYVSKLSSKEVAALPASELGGCAGNRPAVLSDVWDCAAVTDDGVEDSGGGSGGSSGDEAKGGSGSGGGRSGGGGSGRSGGCGGDGRSSGGCSGDGGKDRSGSGGGKSGGRGPEDDGCGSAHGTEDNEEDDDDGDEDGDEDDDDNADEAGNNDEDGNDEDEDDDEDECKNDDKINLDENGCILLRESSLGGTASKLFSASLSSGQLDTGGSLSTGGSYFPVSCTSAQPNAVVAWNGTPPDTGQFSDDDCRCWKTCKMCKFQEWKVVFSPCGDLSCKPCSELLNNMLCIFCGKHVEEIIAVRLAHE